jgi:CRP-like cAMP-binding protein
VGGTVGYAHGMVTPIEHCAAMPERTYERGDVLLKEGTPGPLLILAEGTVEILKGDFRINVVDEPGAIFGEVSVLLGIPPMATVRALEHSRVFVAEDGLAYLSSRTDLALAVARLLAHRLNSVTTYLVDLKRQFEDQQSHLAWSTRFWRRWSISRTPQETSRRVPTASPIRTPEAPGTFLTR